MTVIECALALRRRGVKMPWSSIASGLASATDMGCFEMISFSPMIIIDTAGCIEETALLFKTGAELFGDAEISDFSICIPESAVPLLSVMDGRNIKDLIIVTQKDSLDLTNVTAERVILVQDIKAAARAVCDVTDRKEDVVSCGNASFAYNIKIEILKILNS